MGEIFQLSKLYDTKQKRIIWTDRWDERWINLPKIKSYLSNGLLKALGLIMVNQKERKSINPVAYKLYLKVNISFKKDKLQMMSKIFLNKSFIDKSFVPAIILLGDISLDSQKKQIAKEKYKKALEKAKILELKKEEAQSLVGLASAADEVDISNLEKAFEIFKKINDKYIFCSSRNIKKGKNTFTNIILSIPLNEDNDNPVGLVAYK